MDVDAYVALGRPSRVALDPTGAWLAVEVQVEDEATGRFRGELWRQRVDGSEARRVVGAERDATAPAFGADGALYHLGEVELGEGRRLRQVWRDGACITDEPAGVSEFRVAGDTLALLAPAWPGVAESEQRARWLWHQRHGPGGLHFRRGPPRWWDAWLGGAAPRVVLCAADGSARRPLPQAEPRAHVEAGWDLSADGRWLVITAARPGPERVTDLALRVVETATGQERLVGAEPRWRCSSPRLSADGRYLAAAVHERDPVAYGPVVLRAWDLASGAAPWRLAPGTDLWLEPRGWWDRRVLCTAREEARERAFTVGLEDERAVPLPGPGGTLELHEVHPGRLAGLHHDLLRSPRPAVLAGGAVQDLPSPVPGWDLSPRVRWTEHRVPAPDGQLVHTLLVLPAEAPGPLPTLLWVHGGPVGHWADQWHWRWNAALFASWGFAVALPNPRGSTGYGQAWVEPIAANRWGEACADDVTAVLAWLGARPEVDRDRIAAVGASFGGWMVNFLGGRTAGLRCIVSHAGIFDHRAMGGATDVAPFWAWEQAGSPWLDPAHDRWSPHRALAAWTAPTLVVHGERDYRVPIEQGLSLFEALQQQGASAELLAFPDEGHWVRRPENIRQFHRVVVDFLARHLDGPCPVSPRAPTGW